MSFGRMISLVIALVAVVAVFVEIPIVSDYAFWVLVGALLIWDSVHVPNTKRWFRWEEMLIIALLILVIVSVFVYIPIVSDYAFWFLLLTYLLDLGGSSFSGKKG
jgi:hypothetical protein